MPLRILFDIRHIKDFGIGTYIRNLVPALGRLDQENHYLLVGRKEALRDFGTLPPNFEFVPHYRLDTEPFDQVAFPLLVRRLRVDLSHIPLNAVALFMPKPYVVTIHDMSALMFEHRPGLRHNFFLYRFRRGLLRADKVIAVSEATRHDVEELLGIPPQRVRRIYDALDPRFLQQGPPADARTAGPDTYEREIRRILERYQISQPFILYAGTIRPHKNISRLIEAFAVLRSDLDNHPVYKDLRLIIIGDEISRHPSARRAVIQTRLQDSVRFLGFVPIDTLRIFYATASAFVFPSLYEGFGLPPLEAMAAGTPVVASNVSSIPEVVGDAAVVVNPENVFDIARGIREVLLDENLRRTLREKGQQQVRRFSWDRTAAEVLETYREVAQRRRAA